MDTIWAAALQALVGAGIPVAIIALASAIISSAIWLLRRPKLKAPRNQTVAIANPPRNDAHAHGHGPSEDDPDEWFRSHIINEVQAISAKLDAMSVMTRLAAQEVQKKPSRTSFLPYVLGNMFWSIFGVVVGLIIEAMLNAPAPMYDGF